MEVKDKMRKRKDVNDLRPLATETTGKGKILRLDGNTLGVDSGKVGVLKEGDEVCLGRLLESHNGG